MRRRTLLLTVALLSFLTGCQTPSGGGQSQSGEESRAVSSLADSGAASAASGAQSSQAQEPARMTEEEFFEGYVTEFSAYTYRGESATRYDEGGERERSILLEDLPENEAEELAVLNYWPPSAGEFDSLSERMGSESGKASVESERGMAGKGRFYKETVLHDVSILTKKDFAAGGDYFERQKDADGLFRQLCKEVEENGLTQYTLAYVNVSWKWSDAALKMGPQIGNGRYERLYLLGKRPEDTQWKQYGVYWGEMTLGRGYDQEAQELVVWE